MATKTYIICWHYSGHNIVSAENEKEALEKFENASLLASIMEYDVFSHICPCCGEELES